MIMLTSIKNWAHRIKRDSLAVYYAARDPRTPGYLQLLAILVAAYAISPIDLIPDFIPILGYLDDLIIVPAGLLLVIRLLPDVVLEEARERASHQLAKPANKLFVSVVVVTWLVCVALLIWFFI